MLARLALTLFVLAGTGSSAWSQANIKPDTTPRLPPQAGQGLPLEDQQFIVRAANLSDAEVEAARMAVQKASSAPVKAFAEKMASEHRKLREEIAELARKHQMTIAPHASRSRWQQDLQRFDAATGEAFERDFLAWQLQVHLALAELYQVQASNTPATELARFAIITLNKVQDRFAEAKKLAAAYGLAIDTVKPPPQY